jgi:hypothetical protein
MQRKNHAVDDKQTKYFLDDNRFSSPKISAIKNEKNNFATISGINQFQSR